MILINNSERELVDKAINFMESFYNIYQEMGSANKTFTFPKNEKDMWIRGLYPHLVEKNIIYDDRFFVPDHSTPKMGIGNDGAGNKLEYCNIIYQLYKMAASSVKSFKQDTVITNIIACIRMLEAYTYYFVVNKSAEVSKALNLSGNDMKAWKEIYLPRLVANNILKDAIFFDKNADQSSSNYGIGADGSFHNTELLHFLSQCYKYLYQHN